MTDKEYAKLRQESMVKTVSRKGAVVARYKPGTLVKNSDGATYQVQTDGSWKIVL